jgi:hypothetical protein
MWDKRLCDQPAPYTIIFWQLTELPCGGWVLSGLFPFLFLLPGAHHQALPVIKHEKQHDGNTTPIQPFPQYRIIIYDKCHTENKQTKNKQKPQDPHVNILDGR